jgi:hypothetical protein
MTDSGVIPRASNGAVMSVLDDIVAGVRLDLAEREAARTAERAESDEVWDQIKPE